jgi:hypothetical protein
MSQTSLWSNPLMQQWVVWFLFTNLILWPPFAE